ncbi:MAG TPA: ATP-binding protein [Hyphomicrobiaceae bacterium]|nr:ATP-binding protein [Hyphomicrobiaceae bacterium]
MTEDRLARVLDDISDAVFLLNRRRAVLLSNRRANDWFGQGFENQDFVQVIRHPDCLQAIDDVLGSKKSAETNIVMPGSTTSYNIRVIGLEPETAQDAYVAVIIADLSRLNDVEQMRSDFVANVSHELRSPLTALNGIIETLKGVAKDDPDARQHFLSVMEREAHRMNRLIDDLLSLSKFEANRRIQPSGQTNVRELVDQVIAALSIRAEKEGKRIELSGANEHYMVRGDHDELTQVFQNLIENAIKYGAPGTNIVVALSANEKVSGLAGPAVNVEVRDQGAGIAPNHIPRLTECFYRIEASRSRENGGTGLGLAIVKHIVNRHRGKLQIKSELGVGSSFIVSLPMVAAAS